MKVYRGPSSKPFRDGSHEFVSRVKPEQLEKGIRSKALIRFNITKERLFERRAVCTAQFEEEDVIPMINGLLSRLTSQQECLAKIKEIMGDKSTNTDQKIGAIQASLSTIK